MIDYHISLKDQREHRAQVRKIALSVAIALIVLIAIIIHDANATVYL